MIQQQKQHDVQSKEIILAIDFGTDYVRCGLNINNNFEIIRNEKENTCTPSTIIFNNHSTMIGETCKINDEISCQNYIYQIKKFIGRDCHEKILQKQCKKYPFVFEQEQAQNIIRLQQNILSKIHFEQVISLILEKVIHQAQQQLKTNLESAVISVSSNFNHFQRQSIIDAANLAGLKYINLVNDTSASAIAYSYQIYLQQNSFYLQQEKNQNCLKNQSSNDNNLIQSNQDFQKARNVVIIDIGSGFTDVGVVSIDEIIICESLSSFGDNTVNGEEFTQIIIDYVIEQCQMVDSTFKINCQSVQYIKVRKLCEIAKIELSYKDQAVIYLEKNFPKSSILITRFQFELLSRDLFGSILNLTKYVVEQSKLTISQIQDVILVGGSSRIPKIIQLIREMFNLQPNISMHPKLSVVQGAALLGAQIQYQKQMKQKKENNQLLQINNFSNLLTKNESNLELKQNEWDQIYIEYSDQYRTKEKINQEQQKYQNNIIEDAIQPQLLIQDSFLTSYLSQLVFIEILTYVVQLDSKEQFNVDLLKHQICLPTSQTLTFTTYCDSSTYRTIILKIFNQNDRNVKGKVNFIEFQVEGIKPQPRGVPQIEINFKIDSNGLLFVTGRDKISKEDQCIKIQCKNRINFEQNFQKMKNEITPIQQYEKKQMKKIQSLNQLLNWHFIIKNLIEDQRLELQQQEDLYNQCLSKIKTIKQCFHLSQLSNQQLTIPNLNYQIKDCFQFIQTLKQNGIIQNQC